MAQHVKAVAVLHIVLSALGLLGGVIVLIVFGGIAAIVGASATESDAAVAVPVLGLVGGIIAVILVVLSLPGLIAGWGLLHFQPWARILTLVLSALHLFNIPLGTALAIYSFWVLLSVEGTRLFEQRPSAYPNPAAPR